MNAFGLKIVMWLPVWTGQSDQVDLCNPCSTVSTNKFRLLTRIKLRCTNCPVIKEGTEALQYRELEKR